MRRPRKFASAKPARDVFDVRIEAAVLVDHDHTGQFAGQIRGPGEIRRAWFPSPAVTDTSDTRS